MTQEQNNQQGYTCTGDCLRCSSAQRQYCASQFTFKNMRMLESMMASLQSLSNEVKNLSEKVTAIQNAEAVNPVFEEQGAGDKVQDGISAITASGA